MDAGTGVAEYEECGEGGGGALARVELMSSASRVELLRALRQSADRVELLNC